MTKTLTLISPDVVTFSNTSIQIKMTHEVYSEQKFGVKTPVTHSVLIVSEPNSEGKFDLPLDPQILFGKELVAELSGIKGVIGTCAQLAEHLFGQLKALNERFKAMADLQDCFQDHVPKYEKLDFYGHRKIIGCLIKSGKNDCINEVLKDYDAASVRKVLDAFILDRNKYTHGDLVYWQGEKKTMLEYVNNVTYKPEYAIVNSDILNSFTDSYNELSKIFTMISQCLG